MHYKKRKLFVLYGIPIWFRKRFNSFSKLSLCNKEKLHLVSYSIPLSCMVVLLLGLGLMINPGLFLVDKSSAVTIRDEWVVKNPNEFVSRESAESDVQNTDMINDNTEGDNDSGIIPMAENPDNPEDEESKIGLTVANTDQVIQAVQGGGAVYGSYNIRIDGQGITDYALSIKADSVNLTPPSGSSSIISGAGNKTGNNMAAGTWGYALTDTSTATSNYANLTYKNLPTVDTAILSDKGIMEWRLGVDKDLIFAAKFGEDVTPGNYSSHITLNVVATPRVTTAKWSNGVDSLITTMQEVESGFCKNNSKIGTGNTITLKDSRDGNSYALVKLKDGNCWMQQNLRLGGTSAMNLTPSNTDITSNYTLPAGTNSGSWNTSNYAVQQVRLGNTSWNSSWQTSWGNYYSWCAATAGTCSESTANNVNVSGSICPKGWHLPSGGSSDSTAAGVGQNSEFYKLLNGLNMSTITASPYLFPAAGYVNASNGSLSYAGSNGYYWSRTSTTSNHAYRLYFTSSNFGPGTSDTYRYYVTPCGASPRIKTWIYGAAKRAKIAKIVRFCQNLPL